MKNEAITLRLERFKIETIAVAEVAVVEATFIEILPDTCWTTRR
jgi:hypothetical protein